MEKTLTYEDQVKIKNLLSSIQQDALKVEDIKDAIFKKVKDITEILNMD